MKLPNAFIKTVTQTWKLQGQVWLESLPELVDHFSQMWHLRDIRIFDSLFYNFVARAYSTFYESDVILKICIPGQAHLWEQKALLYFDGQGSVRLLASDEKQGGMLLEALVPGTSLKKYFPQDGLAATKYAAQVMKALHMKPIRAPSHDFQSIKDLCSLFATFEDARMPADLINSAHSLSSRLIKNQSELYLLHGDLHHDNILLSSRGWVAIDPKGIIGERACEVGAFIRNPLPALIEQPDPAHILSQRIDSFADLLALDRQKLIEWSFVQTILAACWALEDDQNCEAFLTIALIIKDEMARSFL